MFNHFDQRMNTLRSTCDKRFDNDNFCNEWIDTLNSKIHDLNERFDLITSSRSREKERCLILSVICLEMCSVLWILDQRKNTKRT